MRDVEIWLRLWPSSEAIEPSVEELIDGFTAVAGEPLSARAGLLGHVHAHRGHADPGVRAAVMLALAGATGILGLRALVEGLDDDVAEVRIAAADALIESAWSDNSSRGLGVGNSTRLLHALFHPRADVRARVVARLPVDLRWVGGFLREDPVCADVVREWPLRDGLRLALDLHARGLASDDELCHALANVEDSELLEILRYSSRRTDIELADARRWLKGAGPVPGGVDVLDRVCAAIDDCGIGRALVPLVRTSRTASTGERMKVAILLRLVANDRIADPLLTFAVRHDPSMLRSERISLGWRKAAVALNAKAGGRSRSDPELVAELLGSTLVREPDGSLDLRTAASLAWLLPAPQHGRLIAAIGFEAVIAALDQRAGAGFAELCELPSASVELRGEHPESCHDPIELIVAVRPEHRARLRAVGLACFAGARSRLTALLESLTEADLHESVAALLVELDAGRIVLADKPTQRLAQQLADVIDSGAWFELLARMLDNPHRHPLGAALVERMLGDAEPSKLILFVHASAERLLRLIEWLRAGVMLPLELEQQLANQLRAHANLEVRTAATSLIEPSIRLSERASLGGLRRLTSAEIEAIATCSPTRLGVALAPALAGPSQGLAHALGRRRAQPSVAACVALLGAHDPLVAVVERVADFFDPTNAEFVDELADAATARWRGHPGLPPLGHAWLRKFDEHALAFGEWLIAEPGGVVAALDRWAALSSFPILGFEAAAAVIALWRYRSPSRIAGLALGPLCSQLVERLDTELGPAAAKILVNLHLAQTCVAELDRLTSRVRTLAPDLDRVTVHELHRWLKLERGSEIRAELTVRPVDRNDELVEHDELVELAGACASTSNASVEAAVRRLVELGERGERRLVEVLANPAPVARADLLARSVGIWTSTAQVDAARALADDPSVHPCVRFRLATSLAERPELDRPSHLTLAFAAARDPESPDLGWFRASDWQHLARSIDLAELAMGLVDSPHPHAYRRAVEWLLGRPHDDLTAVEALRQFLRVGTRRSSKLRRQVAERLDKDIVAIPIRLQAVLDANIELPATGWLWQLDNAMRVRVLEAAVSATLIGGSEAATERRIWTLLEPRLNGSAEAIQRMFVDCVDDTVRTQLATSATSLEWRRAMLGDIAEVFAWGVRRGRELTGRLFRVQMTDKRQDFGYTFLTEDRIFVSPLPLFAGERHGREIVEALVLHELGHHAHHRGPQAAEIWKQAQKRGLHGVLNLVADEHLERNLRSLRVEYGDRLKRLGAYAFQHAQRDLDWTWLLDRLGAASFRILSTKPTKPAHVAGRVRIHRGDLMQALEAGGSSWSRFARALRMGLGDRWGDAKVVAGLELFRSVGAHHFRQADMAELWRITQALAQLFGDELPRAELLGGQETLGESEHEGSVARGGVTNEEIQAEVERILDPRELDARRNGTPRKLAINVGPDERFDRITKVERVARDLENHRAVAREVARHAQRLRSFLCELGLDLVPHGARLRGRSFDRTRIQAVVLRRDPRMLIARELEIRSDLFIGVLIDCSGSMGTQNLLATATRFGVLIAEAVRGLAGVDARFWGFTDSVIWDAGDAERCAVTSLTVSGGNNDAAALLHAAEAATGSRRKAKLLVMISDGLPTQCSVAALRNLVIQLGRKRIVCAQVAVRPLEEVCFPNYVLLADQPIELATVRFGELVSKLASQTLGRR